jgi:hypothetical protein
MKQKIKVIALLVVALYVLARVEKHCETKNEYYVEQSK